MEIWSRKRERNGMIQDDKRERRSTRWIHVEERVEAQASTTVAEFVPPLVVLVCARTSRVWLRGPLRVPVTGFFSLTQEHKVAKRGATTVVVGKASLFGQDVTKRARTSCIFGDREKVGQSQTPRAGGVTVVSTQ